MSVKANKSLDDGLVLYVPMNEGSGSTGFDRAKGNNNAIIPSDIWVVDAEKGVVPHFNNLDSKNLEIPASTDFDLQEQTVSFWFKIDAIDGLNVQVLSRWGGSNNWQVYRNSHNADNQLFIFRNYKNTSGGNTDKALYHGVKQTGVWYHVCMVSHADGKCEDYWNGVKYSYSAPADFDEWNISTHNIYTRMQGYLKDVRIYNRALTETEISALYRLGLNKSLSDGLVLDMPLNEGSGSTVYDRSKNGNNGAISGATWTKDAEMGECLSFDGNDYVEIADDAVLRPSTNDFTWCGWVKTSNTVDQQFVIKRAWISGTNAGFQIQMLPGGRIRVVFCDGTAPRLLYNASAGTEINDGEWHLISVVFDRDDKVSIYDGLTLIGSGDISSQQGAVSNAENLFFGVDKPTGSSFFIGEMRDWRYYNRALSASEINQLYRLTKKGVE